jgi:hypothetical protein
VGGWDKRAEDHGRGLYKTIRDRIVGIQKSFFGVRESYWDRETENTYLLE